MPPSQPPQGPIGTSPGLTAQDLLNNQQNARQANQQSGEQQQQKLQNNADKFKKSIFKKIQNKTIQPGALIVFRYNFYKHDPSPLCLVGRMGMNGMLSGLNLHYLTFRYVKQLVQMYCGKNFNYQLIKGNKYIVNAYRSYKREGRKDVQVLDCDFLLGVLGTVRSFKPSELEAIRQSVQKQLQEKMHPTAEDVSKQYQNYVRPQDHTAFGTNKEMPDARMNPNNMQQPELPQ
jgi:hypothetical protein